MPFKTVKGAKDRIPALKNKTTKQVKAFIATFNSVVASGKSEDSAIPIAIAAANKVKKSMGDMILNKNTMQDKKNMLRDAVSNKFGDSWVMDFDDDFVFFERWDHLNQIHENFKVSYSISDIVNVEIGDNPVKVIRLTEFKEVDDGNSSHLDDLEKSIVGKLTGWFEKNFGGSKDNTGMLIKQFNDEQMIAIEPLYIAPMDVDGHGDTITLEGTEELVKSFNDANEAGTLQTALFHNHKTKSFVINKAWVNPCDCIIGETKVPSGQPLAEIQFTNEKAWELRKSGVLMGLSIGARATEIEELI